MKLDFNEIPEKKLEHFKGGEMYLNARMYSDEKIKIMKASLVPGASIGLHTHDTSLEVVFITAGEGVMLCDGQEEILRPGMATYCPKGHGHTLMNRGTENLEFYAVVPEVG